MHSPHASLTLDDDLYGNRAIDNQIKTISNRNAVKEGHCADAMADPFSRLTLYVRFRRRGQLQASSVHELLSTILKDKGRAITENLLQPIGVTGNLRLFAVCSLTILARSLKCQIILCNAIPSWLSHFCKLAVLGTRRKRRRRDTVKEMSRIAAGVR